MNEPEWKRQSRIKQEAWKWAARRLELEVVADELEGGLSEDERLMLDHVRKVICKNLTRQADRIGGRHNTREKTLVEVFGFDKMTDEQKRENLLVDFGIAK